MSTNMNYGTVGMCNYTIRAAMLPIFLAMLIPAVQSYAGGNETDVNAVAQSIKKVATTSNVQREYPSAPVANKSESERQYDTPLSDYENGGYFSDSQARQTATAIQSTKSESRYDTSLSDYENGGYFGDK